MSERILVAARGMPQNGRFRQHVSIGLKAPFEKHEPRARLLAKSCGNGFEHVEELPLDRHRCKSLCSSFWPASFDSRWLPSRTASISARYS